MFVIGITGGTGAGKTTALEVFRNLGGLSLDCDEIYHQLLVKNADLNAELSECFPGVLVDGVVDRKKLGKLVFRSPSALFKLNDITHKYVDDEVKREIANWRKRGGKFAAVDAIALLESDVSKRCDVLVGVIAPEDVRIARIMRRDGIDAAQARQRISAQKPNSFFIENCDYILHNTHETPEEFGAMCEKLFKKILKLNKGETSYGGKK